MHKDKLIVILGPTSSGKSALAIKLAKKIDGEIISADSRQVYKGLDIGTGKVTKKEQKIIPHHLLDVYSPKKQFTVALFKPLAQKAIEKTRAKNKVPFLVGGTPFYIYATIDNLNIPEVKPDLKLRKKLETKPKQELYRLLKKLDPQRAKNIDKNNPRRLIRAIEIVKKTGAWIPSLSLNKSKPADVLILGIKKDFKALYKLIDNRLEARLNRGLVGEIKKLLKQKISHKRLQEFGLEYRFVSLYLQKKLTYEQMVEKLKQAIHKFAKRQMTWFQTDRRIRWVTSEKQAEKLIRKYLRK